MIDPVTAVADSLQALRNGTTDEQWNGLKADPLLRDLIGRCADLESALLLADEGAVKVATGKTAAFKSAVDAGCFWLHEVAFHPSDDCYSAGVVSRG